MIELPTAIPDRPTLHPGGAPADPRRVPPRRPQPIAILRGTGICAATIVLWLADEETEAPPGDPSRTALVPVTIVDELRAPGGMDGGRFEVRLPSGVEIAVPQGFDRASLESLLVAVRLAAC